MALNEKSAFCPGFDTIFLPFPKCLRLQPVLEQLPTRGKGSDSEIGEMPSIHAGHGGTRTGKRLTCRDVEIWILEIAFRYLIIEEKKKTPCWIGVLKEGDPFFLCVQWWISESHMRGLVWKYKCAQTHDDCKALTVQEDKGIHPQQKKKAVPWGWLAAIQGHISKEKSGRAGFSLCSVLTSQQSGLLLRHTLLPFTSCTNYTNPCITPSV